MAAAAPVVPVHAAVAEGANAAAPTVVLVIGEVNSGKSSVISSLAGGFASCSSIQRETFKPVWLQFRADGQEAVLDSLATQWEARQAANADHRSKIQELKEEQVASLEMLTDDEHSLPLRWGLSPWAIIDMPGINDAHDHDQKFFRAIENRIAQADLIIYVTDATSAFSKESEVKEFTKILALVNQEKQAGHWVELMVVANKYDEIHMKSLGLMFDAFRGTLEKMGVAADRVFRFSAHKMLVATLLRHQLTLTIPSSREEITQVMKTANMQKSKKLLESIKAGKLAHSDIALQEDFDEPSVLPADEKMAKVEGPGAEIRLRMGCGIYEQFLESLREFQQQIPVQRIKQLKEYISTQWEKLKSIALNAAVATAPTDEVHALLRTVLGSRVRFQDLKAEKELTDLLFADGAFWELAKKQSAAPTPILTGVVKSLFRFVMGSGNAFFNAQLETHHHGISWELRAAWLQFAVVSSSGFGSRDKYLPVLKAVMSDPRAYADTKIDLFPEQCIPQPPAASWQLRPGIFSPAGVLTQDLAVPSCAGHHSFLVYNLLNSPQTPQLAKLLVLLSITPVSAIHALLDGHHINLTLLASYDPQLVDSLRLVFARPDAFPINAPLEQGFFALDKNPAVVEYHTVIKARFLNIKGAC